MMTDSTAKEQAETSYAEGAMRLAVVIENRQEWQWLDAFDFVAAEILPILFYCIDGPDLTTAFSGRLVAHQIHNDPSVPVLPDFAEIVTGLEQEATAACFIVGEGPLSRLTATAADLAGIPVFLLVTTDEQMANLGRRKKRRPDLFFLADSRLFPTALSDTRYGSTLLPTGHPGRDLFLRGTLNGDTPFGDSCFGDGQAGERILSTIGRWRDNKLDPADPELSIIVPAYNEAENLPLVCDRLIQAFENKPIAAEILLVDDVSTDDTQAVAREQMWRSSRIRAFTKPLPRGMGHGIRYGLRRARAPIIAITMGDGSDEVSKIPEMVRKVRDEGMALAIGSRYRHRRNYQNVPPLYRFWSFCFRQATRFFIGINLKDCTNSFRVYHRDIFKRYGPESGGFEISPETTFKAWFATHRVAEVDVCHLKRASGQSNFSFLRAAPGYATTLFKAIINRLTGRWFIIEW